ncbi:MAG TPA: ferritin-like domain-containing protein [Streptosporangiaceae bacterium]|jgi:hypothetical protein
MSGPADTVTGGALQGVLAAVDAASYGYGVAGAHLPTAGRAAAQRDWADLQVTRDELVSMLASRGAPAPAARDAYQLPFPVHSAPAAVSLAGYLQNRLAAAYLGLVALDDPALRAWGARQAQACAVRATGWLGRTVAFPGLSTQAVSPARVGPVQDGRARPAASP